MDASFLKSSSLSGYFNSVFINDSESLLIQFSENVGSFLYVLDPLSFFLISIRTNSCLIEMEYLLLSIDHISVPLIISPFSFKRRTIWISLDTYYSINDCNITSSMYLSVFPISIVDSAISPLIDARTVDIVVVEVPCVGAVVGPSELTLAVFLSLEVLPIVRGTVRPSLDT